MLLRDVPGCELTALIEDKVEAIMMRIVAQVFGKHSNTFWLREVVCSSRLGTHLAGKY